MADFVGMPKASGTKALITETHPSEGYGLQPVRTS